MQADVDPFQSSIYFRVVQSKGLGDMVFHCIHSTTQKNWQSGDSGTWCWTEDGLLLGMAYAHIDNQHYCCIQPMAHVVEAIKHLRLRMRIGCVVFIVLHCGTCKLKSCIN